MVQDSLDLNPSQFDRPGVNGKYQRVLVGKILIERTHANPGSLGDSPRCEAKGTFLSQNANTRCQNVIAHLPGATLLRLFA
ncbi:hypothetical protein MPC4_510004 [Methylocella tundrae]|uniref:Uncharacterized protein n=1 Tax=Methylocella tundrae TaxID=227605 RepID=A0A8B6MBH3_METTU|nr:hypothetical protein MPC4_510004 [Methylocella tundrae]